MTDRLREQFGALRAEGLRKLGPELVEILASYHGVSLMNAEASLQLLKPEQKQALVNAGFAKWRGGRMSIAPSRLLRGKSPVMTERGDGFTLQHSITDLFEVCNKIVNLIRFYPDVHSVAAFMEKR